MIRVVIATQDHARGYELQRTVLEVENAEVAFIATSSIELRSVLQRLDPDVTLVDRQLGPEPAMSVVRDMCVRHPATAMLIVSASPDAELVTSAMEAGARGIVGLPAAYAQLEERLVSAAAWSVQMRRVLASRGAGQSLDESGRGRLVGIAGAKGGVGATTVATHLALDVARTSPGTSTCLVDLDLEKGDVPAHVEVRHRLGVSDLAKVAEDLSPGTVADAMTQHESGVDMLLAPADIRDVEAVTPGALRQVVAALRRQYDLVLVDLGSHVTPAQATVVELVDEVVLVVTPDVAALRGMRRTIDAWESLGVCKETDLRVLVNRSSKLVTVSADTVRQLTKASVLPVELPAGFRRLEPALNTRDPFAVRSRQWWAGLRSVGAELSLLPSSGQARAPSAAARASRPARSRRLLTDRGQIALETVAILPLLALLALLVWHVTMIGAGAVLQAHAGAAATRAAGVHADPQQAARDALPDVFAGGVEVAETRRGLVVSVAVPAVGVGFPGLPTRLSSTREVVYEP